MRPTRPSADLARSVALGGALIALACALALAESAFVPPLPVPGVRLGLANLAVVIALVWAGPRVALVVSVGRVVATGMLAGSLSGPAFLMALAGAICAWAVMAMLSGYARSVSVVGLSAAGSFAHVAAQLLVAGLLTGTWALLSLAPLSLAAAIVSGCAIGGGGRVLLSRMPLVSKAGCGKGSEDGATGGHAFGRAA